MMKQSYSLADRINRYNALCILALILSVIGLCNNVIASQADPVNATDRAFLVFLKDAVVHHKVREIAERVEYPLRVNHGKSSDHTLHSENIGMKEEFIAHYDEIFTEKVKAAIIRQNPDTLFKDWHGLMIGNGEIWCVAVSSDSHADHYAIRIVAINTL